MENNRDLFIILDKLVPESTQSCHKTKESAEPAPKAITPSKCCSELQEQNKRLIEQNESLKFDI